MTSPADWYDAASRRWAHLPEGEERDHKVQRTFEEIRRESEHIALRLPALSKDEEECLLEEAVLDIWHRLGAPETPEQEEIYHSRVDDLYYRLCLVAREQKAPARLREKLSERRMVRKWVALLGDGYRNG